MYLYSIGDSWDTELPPGESFGFYWQPGGGLQILSVASRLRESELAGYREGEIRCAFGTTRGGLLVVAALFTGWGWADGVIAHISEEISGHSADEGREAAERWARDGTHGTVTAILLERPAETRASSPARGWVRLEQTESSSAPVIAALRFFTLSVPVTRYVGAVLAQLYSREALTGAEYEQQVREFQSSNPHAERWVRKSAAVSCKGGD